MAQNITENRTSRHTQKRAFKEDLYSLYAQIAPCLPSQMECHRTNKDEEKERDQCFALGNKGKRFSIGGLSLFI